MTQILYRRFGLTVFALAAFVVSSAAHAQPSSAATPATIPVTSVQPTPETAASAAVPLPDIAAQAEDTSADLREMLAPSDDDEIARGIADDLPGMMREINSRAVESAKILPQRPPLETLRALERGWIVLHGTLSDWTAELSRQTAALDQSMTQLDHLTSSWKQTADVARAAGTPPEINARIATLITQINTTRDALAKRRSDVLALQNRVSVQDIKVSEVLAAYKLVRQQMLERLYVKDSVALWSGGLLARAADSLTKEGADAVAVQMSTLKAFVSRQNGLLFAHAAILVLIVFGFQWAHRTLRSVVADEGGLKRAFTVFAMPISAALVVVVFASRWVYPEAPRILWAFMGTAALIPTTLMMRRLVPRSVMPLLYAILCFYFFDQLRAVLAALQVVPRLLFMLETSLGALFLIMFLKTLHRLRVGQTTALSRHAKFITLIVSIATAVFVVTCVANALGYLAFANLLGNAALNSAYYGVLMWTLVEIFDALIELALRVRPLILLGTVRSHAPVFAAYLRKLLVWAAIAFWLWFVLERLLISEQTLAIARAVLDFRLPVGSLGISLGDIVAFVLTVWASFLISRLVQFFLEEDFYPRANLQRGLPYAISRTLHYVILVTGFCFAMAALGVDMTKFTILAGAFTVGVGFGLQNIFNNFVSGLILLFERPVQVGDVIQMDDASGTVEQIGIRASIIRTGSGSEIIVPNGKLISDRLTNWTLSNRQRGIDIQIAVAYPADPKRVLDLLERVALDHPLVNKEPAPRAQLTRLGPEWLGFELRIWTDEIEKWTTIRSDVSVAVSEALTAENISLH